MAFDMGFNARGTAGYVTDGPEGVPLLGESYPHTYTNGNGDSINAGFDGFAGIIDWDSTNDPRIAGGNYSSTGGRTFTVDLSSGSAPGTGNYTVDLAFGDPTTGRSHNFELRDTSTVLIDGTNGGTQYTTQADEYIDATLALISATTTWTGTTVSKTFATTTANLVYNVQGTNLTILAHFRLTLQAGAAQAIFTQDHIGRGIGRGIFAGR
jgi:hypothetical protein